MNSQNKKRKILMATAATPRPMNKPIPLKPMKSYMSLLLYIILAKPEEADKARAIIEPSKIFFIKELLGLLVYKAYDSRSFAQKVCLAIFICEHNQHKMPTKRKLQWEFWLYC